MKVLFVVHSLNVGGTERLIRDMALSLPERGIEPAVFCLEDKGVLASDLERSGIKVFCGGRKKGVDLGLIWRLAGLIRSEKIDVVNPHQYTPYFYAAAALMLAGKASLIFTEHGRFYPDRLRPKRVIFNKLAVKFTYSILAVCDFTKKALVKYERLPEDGIKVIYNGIRKDKARVRVDRAEKLKTLGLSPDVKLVGAAGRLCLEKDYPMMIRAFSLVKKRIAGTKLVIAGGGALETELRKLADGYGLSGDVMFLGERHDVPELLGCFDVFALSSVSEGASLVLLEAMSAALPIVATEAGGNPELISNGRTGLLSKTGDHEAFSEAIIRLLSDRALAGRLGTAAAKEVDKRFSFEKMVDEYAVEFRIAGWRDRK